MIAFAFGHTAAMGENFKCMPEAETAERNRARYTAHHHRIVLTAICRLKPRFAPKDPNSSSMVSLSNSNRILWGGPLNSVVTECMVRSPLGWTFE
jgi:hypothetical protein